MRLLQAEAAFRWALHPIARSAAAIGAAHAIVERVPIGELARRDLVDANRARKGRLLERPLLARRADARRGQHLRLPPPFFLPLFMIGSLEAATAPAGLG